MKSKKQKNKQTNKQTNKTKQNKTKQTKQKQKNKKQKEKQTNKQTKKVLSSFSNYISRFEKLKAKEKKRKKEKVLSSFSNFSLLPFSIFLLFLPPFLIFSLPLFPVGQQKFPDQKSLGGILPPTCYATGVPPPPKLI